MKGTCYTEFKNNDLTDVERTIHETPQSGSPPRARRYMLIPRSGVLHHEPGSHVCISTHTQYLKVGRVPYDIRVLVLIITPNPKP